MQGAKSSAAKLLLPKSMEYSTAFTQRLTHCGLMMPYGDRDLGQHWLRWWLIAWQYQAITWTKVD